MFINLKRFVRGQMVERNALSKSEKNFFLKIRSFEDYLKGLFLLIVCTRNLFLFHKKTVMKYLKRSA